MHRFGVCRADLNAAILRNAQLRQSGHGSIPMQYIVAYIATAVVFFVADFVWLGVVMKGFYRDRLGALMAEQVNIPVAGLFYLAFVLGIVIFAVAPALSAGSWGRALLFGALFGFFAYGTYDMTNWATLRDWPAAVSIVDLAWGTVLTGVSATAGYLITRWIMG
jgi:uncharacterized membrane protein